MFQIGFKAELNSRGLRSCCPKDAQLDTCIAVPAFAWTFFDWLVWQRKLIGGEAPTSRGEKQLDSIIITQREERHMHAHVGL